MKHTFSIITVSYNSEKTIEQTILSVLNQTYSDYEYIIIDGGSTDKTVEIIKKYQDSFNGRLRWVSEPDDGIYYAMNKGIALAKGQYIGLLNSDDWYQEQALEHVANKVTGNEDVLFGLLNTWLNEKLLRVYANFLDHLPTDSLAHPSSFISKETYLKFGLYSTQYKSASDYEMFLRLQKAGCNFKYVDSVITNFRLGGTSCSSLGYFETIDIRRQFGLISKQVYKKLYIKRKVTDVLQTIYRKF